MIPASGAGGLGFESRLGPFWLARDFSLGAALLPSERYSGSPDGHSFLVSVGRTSIVPVVLFAVFGSESMRHCGRVVKASAC